MHAMQPPGSSRCDDWRVMNHRFERRSQIEEGDARILSKRGIFLHGLEGGTCFILSRVFMIKGRHSWLWGHAAVFYKIRLQVRARKGNSTVDYR